MYEAFPVKIGTHENLTWSARSSDLISYFLWGLYYLRDLYLQAFWKCERFASSRGKLLPEYQSCATNQCQERILGKTGVLFCSRRQIIRTYVMWSITILFYYIFFCYKFIILGFCSPKRFFFLYYKILKILPFSEDFFALLNSWSLCLRLLWFPLFSMKSYSSYPFFRLVLLLWFPFNKLPCNAYTGSSWINTIRTNTLV